MRLTRRGRLLAVVISIGFFWAAMFGIQTMNAVLLPGIVTLVAGWWLVRGADQVSVHRQPVEDGFPDQPREVRVSVATPASLSGTVVETVPTQIQISEDRDNVQIDPNDPTSDPWGTSGIQHPEFSVVSGVASYYVKTGQRGVVELGPSTVRLTDPFGLVAETFVCDQTTSVLTYPPVHTLVGLREQQHRLPEGAPTPDRHEFDRLREYARGDTPRDIDWKSSAKRDADPLIVKEFVSETEAGDVQIIAESEAGGADRMASAAASIALQLLREGIPVGLVTADQSVEIATEGTQEGKMLAALGRTHGGKVDWIDHSGASIAVWSSGNDVRITLGEGEVTFDQLIDEGSDSAGPALADGGWRV